MSLVAFRMPYLLKISLDWDAPNPREDYDNLGTMVCWHKRYALGDKHDFGEPDDFLRELVGKNVEGKEVLRQAKAGRFPEIRLYYHRSEKQWIVESYDTYFKTWYREAECAAPYEQCREELAEAVLNTLDMGSLYALAKERCCILPVYLFDHTCLHISTQDLTKWPDGRWDAGQVGWIYADRETIAKEYGSCGPEEMEKAGNVLCGEVELYDKYLTGECYGFQLFQNGEETDSCWGFLGDFDEVKEDIKSYLPTECQELLEHLVEVQDIRAMECGDYEELLEEMEDER